MENHSRSLPAQEQQEKSLFLFVVVVGYIVTFTVASNSGAQYSVAELLAGIFFGVIYLLLGFFESELLGRFSPARRNTLFFSVELALVLGIGWTLGPGGNWLIGLPLAGMAVELLSPFSRWFVYAGLLLAIVLPILRYSTWDVALMNAFVISAAIFFVVVVTQLRLNEHQARQKAEDLALQLEMANYKLAEYAAQVEELAAAHERNRLAREIHDHLGHYLTVVNVQIEAARITLGSEPRRAEEALEKAQELVKKGLASVRESVSALRASPLENRPLEQAIESLLHESRALGIAVEFRLLGRPESLEEKVALALYRAAQEALTNVHRHARASYVEVELDFSIPGAVRLSVRDDGIGATDTHGGFGLIGIRERVHLLGGELRTQSEPGKGFCLEVQVPCAERDTV